MNERIREGGVRGCKGSKSARERQSQREQNIEGDRLKYIDMIVYDIFLLH